METPGERLVRYLQDIHALEIGALHAVDSPLSDGLKISEEEAISAYRAQTKLQGEAVETRLGQLGATPSKIKGFVNGVLGAVSEWMDVAHDPDDRAAMALIRYYGLAQTKAAAYEALTAYANAANDSMTLEMAQAHQSCEFAAADRLFDLLPSVSADIAPVAVGSSSEGVTRNT